MISNSQQYFFNILNKLRRLGELISTAEVDKDPSSNNAYASYDAKGKWVANIMNITVMDFCCPDDNS